jgi:hypothetical protein
VLFAAPAKALAVVLRTCRSSQNPFPVDDGGHRHALGDGGPGGFERRDALEGGADVLPEFAVGDLNPRIVGRARSVSSRPSGRLMPSKAKSSSATIVVRSP